jgi:hypothetical protein
MWRGNCQKNLCTMRQENKRVTGIIYLYTETYYHIKLQKLFSYTQKHIITLNCIGWLNYKFILDISRWIKNLHNDTHHIILECRVVYYEHHWNH